MVLWCRKCGEVIGLFEPIDNWFCDHTGICAICVGGMPELAEKSGSVIAAEPIGEATDSQI